MGSNVKRPAESACFLNEKIVTMLIVHIHDVKYNKIHLKCYEVNKRNMLNCSMNILFKPNANFQKSLFLNSLCFACT